MSSTDQKLALVGEIVALLYANNSMWCKCGGAQTRTGLTPEQLLPLLQASDPSVNWDATLLDQMLAYGKRIGALRQQSIGSSACVLDVSASLQYFVNCNMLFENNLNRVFLSIIPGLPSPG